MGCPSGMPYSTTPDQGISFQGYGESLVDSALLLEGVLTARGLDADPGAVVASVFKPPESFKNDRRGGLGAGIAYDATHK